MTKKERNNLEVKRYRQRNYDKVRLINRSCTLKRQFGITLEEYQKLFESQQGLCAICSQPESVVDWRSKEVKRLAVDHCHKTGKIRGLLCTNCNHGLGKFKDNPMLLQKALDYLCVY